MFPCAGVLCTSGLVLLASSESAFPPDTSWPCISIPNSDCLFSLSFDQGQAARPAQLKAGPADPTQGFTVTAAPGGAAQPLLGLESAGGHLLALRAGPPGVG